MEILKNQELRLTNILATRFEDHHEKAQSYTEKLVAHAEAQGAEVVGVPITTLYEVESDDENVVGMEVFLPISQTIASDDANDMTYLEELSFDNCLKLAHEGEPETIENTYAVLAKYIEENRLVPVSNIFNVARLDEAHELLGLDVYISAVTQADFEMQQAIANSSGATRELSEEELFAVDGGRNLINRVGNAAWGGVRGAAVGAVSGAWTGGRIGKKVGGPVGAVKGAKYGAKGGAISGGLQGVRNGWRR